MPPRGVAGASAVAAASGRGSASATGTGSASTAARRAFRRDGAAAATGATEAGVDVAGSGDGAGCSSFGDASAMYGSNSGMSWSSGVQSPRLSSAKVRAFRR